MPDYSISFSDFKLQLPTSSHAVCKVLTDTEFITTFYDGGALKKEHSCVVVADSIYLDTPKYSCMVNNKHLPHGTYVVTDKKSLCRLDIDAIPEPFQKPTSIAIAEVILKDFLSFVFRITSLCDSFWDHDCQLLFSESGVVFFMSASSGVVCERGLLSHAIECPACVQLQMSDICVLRDLLSSVFAENDVLSVSIGEAGELEFSSPKKTDRLLWKKSLLVDPVDVSFKSKYQYESDAFFLITRSVLNEVSGTTDFPSYLSFFFGNPNFLQLDGVNVDIQSSETSSKLTSDITGIYIPSSIKNAQVIFVLPQYRPLLNYYLSAFGGVGVGVLRLTPDDDTILLHLYPIASLEEQENGLVSVAYVDTSLPSNFNITICTVSAPDEKTALQRVAQQIEVPATLLTATIVLPDMARTSTELTPSDILAAHDGLKKSLIALLKKQGVSVKRNDPRTITQLMTSLNTAKSLFDD